MIEVLEVKLHEFVVGGVEAYIADTVRLIGKSDDITIDVFTDSLKCENKYSKELKKICRSFLLCNENSSKGIWHFFMQLNKLLKKNRYDIVHIHAGALSYLSVSAFAAKIHKVPVIIVHSHSTGVSDSIRHKIAKTVLSPLLYICPTDYIACSEDAGLWKFPESIAKKKTVIIKNGIDINKFGINEEKRQEYRIKLGYDDNELVIGHVGRFSKEKNHDYLIDIFFEIQKKDNRYKLLLLGDGALKDSLKLKAEKLGLSDSVVFTGNVSNVQDYMQAMDLFVLPSEYEGLGIVGIEAQACGLPCVFSTGVPEEAKLTENVEFVSLGDKDKWVATIKKMIKLPKSDNTEKIREAGYDINETAKQLESIYLDR